MKTPTCFNRSAILYSLLTTYQGREIELLHDFAQLFNQLATFSNDVIYGGLDQHSSNHEQVMKEFVKVLRSDVQRVQGAAERAINRQWESDDMLMAVECFSEKKDPLLDPLLKERARDIYLRRIGGFY